MRCDRFLTTSIGNRPLRDPISCPPLVPIAGVKNLSLLRHGAGSRLPGAARLRHTPVPPRTKHDYGRRVTFRILLHTGFAAPADALDLLWPRLDGKRDDVRFARVDAEIRATWDEDASIRVERDEREEIGRRAVLDIMRDACERAPQLEADWFAVSPLR
jgi:hypothetical protein